MLYVYLVEKIYERVQQRKPYLDVEHREGEHPVVLPDTMKCITFRFVLRAQPLMRIYEEHNIQRLDGCVYKRVVVRRRFSWSVRDYLG